MTTRSIVGVCPLKDFNFTKCTWVIIPSADLRAPHSLELLPPPLLVGLLLLLGGVVLVVPEPLDLLQRYCVSRVFQCRFQVVSIVLFHLKRVVSYHLLAVPTRLSFSTVDDTKDTSLGGSSKLSCVSICGI